MNENNLKQSIVKIAEEDRQEKINLMDKDPSTIMVNPDEKRYILLMIIENDISEEEKIFEVITGRVNAYNYLKDMIECMNIYESKIMGGNVSYNDAISVYDFMSWCQYNELVKRDGFDIEDYS